MEHRAVPEPPVDPATVFTSPAEIVYNRASDSEVYTAICSAATLLVAGCDHASVMLRSENTYVTVAASDDVARRIDDLERAVGEGPASMPSTTRSHRSTHTWSPRRNGHGWPPGFSPAPRSAARWGSHCWSRTARSAL